MGNITQKRQITILSAVIVLSTLMITSMVASSLPLFDQKADAFKSKYKKFISKAGGSGGNGGDGGNGGNTGGNTISTGN